MPVDINKKEATSRLSCRSRDLAYKRAKGEVSCAECRRLKLKCDRKTPCTACVRRGCQIICPNGSLTAGQGSRFVLADTDKLHEKLLEMSKRIRQLEDALQISHANTSPTTHPLLSEDLLAIKSGVSLMFESERLEGDIDEVTNVLSSELGTLSISERGETCFMGRGSSEALLMVLNESLEGEEDSAADSSRSSDIIPQLITSISDAFPFSPEYHPKEQALEMIEARIPSYARATALAEAYLTNIAWAFMVVDREQIFEELLPSVYKRPRSAGFTDGEDADDGYQCSYVHRLALLLSVLAAGAAGDLTLPLGNDEAELYIHLSRAALSLESVFFGTSIESVQAVLLLATYDFSSSRKPSLESSWKMMFFGLTLASSIGLHRDPARWDMGRKLVQRRRRLFWEIFGLDKWKSLESGRPALFNLREVDCEFPEDTEETLDDLGSPVPGFWRWKYRFIREILAPIAEQLCLTRPHKYSEILELDRKLRDFETHPTIPRQQAPGCDHDMLTTMRRYNWTALREIALLFVHRSFFARALLENPIKPLGSPFASSLLSAYASAVTLLKIVRVYFEKNPDLLLRQWMIWAHGLTSAVIVGCISCRGPVSPVSITALKELEEAVELFKKAQVHPVPRSALPFMQRLLEKARNANQPVPKEAGNSRQELSVLGGIPIFLNKANKKSPTSSGKTSPTLCGLRQSNRDEQLWNVYPNAGYVTSGQMVQSQHSASAVPPQTPPDFLHQTGQNRYQPPSDANAISPTSMTGIWPDHFMDASPGSSSPLTSFASHDPRTFSGWHHNPQHLSSTSWLEELSGQMLVGFGQDNFSENNATNLDLLWGSGTQAAPVPGLRPEQGDDPIVAEAWHTLLAGS